MIERSSSSETLSSTIASAPSAPSGVSSKITVLPFTTPLYDFILPPAFPSAVSTRYLSSHCFSRTLATAFPSLAPHTVHFSRDILKLRSIRRNSFGYSRRLERLQPFQNNHVSFRPHRQLACCRK